MNRSIFHVAGRVAALTLVAAGVSLQAQTPSKAVPELDLRAALKAPVNPFAAYITDADAGSSSSSSSAGDATASVPEDRLSFAGDSLQPPPRRRYGRPRYTDKSHNADGSNKYAFSVGGGFTLPTGGTHNYFSTSWDFQAGVGRNFNKNVGVMLDFNWANFGIQTPILNNQLGLYNNLPCDPTLGDCSPLTQLGGYGHVWSFAIDPIYNFAQTDRTGAYVTGGVGFYHKITTFTTPGIGEYCDFYGFCYQYQANQPIDSYTSNAFGVNVGLGYTYKFSRFSNTKFYVEGRYIYNANSRKPESGTTQENSTGDGSFNAFPQNSAPTTFIPITFGLRF
ncbi:MAG TPA: hypothetical protein VGC07_01925 [Granulicella sp.]